MTISDRFWTWLFPRLASPANQLHAARNRLERQVMELLSLRREAKELGIVLNDAKIEQTIRHGAEALVRRRFLLARLVTAENHLEAKLCATTQQP